MAAVLGRGRRPAARLDVDAASGILVLAGGMHVEGALVATTGTFVPVSPVGERVAGEAAGDASGLDDVDRRRIRAALTAVATVTGGGAGAVLGLSYLERCAGCAVPEALPLIGLVPSWGAAAAVALGRWAWTRGFGAGVAAACLLAWSAAHFVFDGMVRLYGPAIDVVAIAGWSVGFLAYWTLVTVAMVAGVLGAGWAAERVA